MWEYEQPITSDELYHSIFSRKSHKYVAKIKKGKRTRYFYDLEEYRNYLKGKTNPTDNQSKNVKENKDEIINKIASNKSEFVDKKAIPKNQEVIDMKKNIESGKTFVDKQINQSSKSIISKKSTENMKQKVEDLLVKIKEATSDIIDKNKQKTSDIIDKTKETQSKFVDDQKRKAMIKLAKPKNQEVKESDKLTNNYDTQKDAYDNQYSKKDIINNIKKMPLHWDIIKNEACDRLNKNKTEITDDECLQYYCNSYGKQQNESLSDFFNRTGAFSELRDGGHPNSYDDLKRLDQDVNDDLDMLYINFENINSPPGKDYDGDGIQDEFDNIGYATNCAYCTVAYEMRQRGYDVEASSAGFETCNTHEVIQSWYENGKYEMLPKYTDMYTIEKEILKNSGENSRGCFVVDWTIAGGHSMVYEVENGVVYIRDCQINKKYKLIEYPDAKYIDRAFYMRTDNLNLTDAALVAVKNRKTK